MSPSEILKGVRILAFTTGYAGPFAGRLLAGYGAEVIKVESKKGGLDTFRHYGQHKDIDAAPRFIETNVAYALRVNCDSSPLKQWSENNLFQFRDGNYVSEGVKVGHDLEVRAVGAGAPVPIQATVAGEPLVN